MATTGPEDRERIARRDELEPEREKSIKVVAGGSITEAVAGAAAVVLAIVGLAGTFPGYMACIATIAFGVALLAQGGAVAARYRRLLHEVTPLEWDARMELGGGMGAEFIGGATGVVLGVLGLLGLATTTLIAVAVIVFGAALLLGGGATADLGSLGGPARHAHIARQATVAASGTQMLVGIGAVVLGIIALVGADALLIELVALLVLGASVLLSGAAVGTRLMSALRR
jgi:hypothetical protein